MIIAHNEMKISIFTGSESRFLVRVKNGCKGALMIPSTNSKNIWGMQVARLDSPHFSSSAWARGMANKRNKSMENSFVFGIKNNLLIIFQQLNRKIILS